LPLTDDAADRAYNMLDAVDKETEYMKGPVGTRVAQPKAIDPNNPNSVGQN